MVGLFWLCLVAHPLALRAVAHRVTGLLHLQGGGETKVSFERIGTKVTSAEGRLGPSTSIVAATLRFNATCCTAGSISLSVEPLPHDSHDIRVAAIKFL